MHRNLITELHDLLRTVAHCFDSYRPELHYMRGPGPKWHAKHRAAAAPAKPAGASDIPALGEIATAHA